MLKNEAYYCLKCGALVILPYLPSASHATRQFFDDMNTAQLCVKCVKRTEEIKKPYLH